MSNCAHTLPSDFMPYYRSGIAHGYALGTDIVAAKGCCDLGLPSHGGS